jgi:hypothetical protein
MQAQETDKTRIVTNHTTPESFDFIELVNGAEGIIDIKGKAAMGSGERAGKRASFKFVSSQPAARDHPAAAGRKPVSRDSPCYVAVLPSFSPAFFDVPSKQPPR